MAQIWGELKRKTIHLAGIIIPIAYHFVDKKTGIIAVGSVTALYFLLELLRFISPQMRRIFYTCFSNLLRWHERKEITGCGYFLTGALITIILFSKEYAIVCLYFAILGDVFAAIVGIQWGRIKLFPGKTLEGSFACLAVCLLIGFVLLQQKPEIAIVGALTATLMELMPLGINDNLTIPVISGLVMNLVGKLF